RREMHLRPATEADMPDNPFYGTERQDRSIELPWWRRRRIHLIGAAVGTLVIVLALVAMLRHVAGAQNSVDRSRLTIATVARGLFVRDLEADGQVVAAVSPTLYAPATGTVALKVHAGDAVRRGQVLIVLDSPDLTANLAQEQASLQSMRLDWQRAQLDASSKLAQLQETYQQAKVDQTTAQRDLDRSRQAYKLGSYTELQMLKDQDDLVKDLQRQVAALQVRSPVDGRVGQVQTEDRATVAKDTALITVVDLSALEVEINVPESQARDLAPGMGADIEGDGQHWPGSVSAVSPQVVNGEVVARVRFGDAKPEGLRQSQRMSVRILIDQR